MNLTPEDHPRALKKTTNLTSGNPKENNKSYSQGPCVEVMYITHEGCICSFYMLTVLQSWGHQWYTLTSNLGWQSEYVADISIFFLFNLLI